LVEIDVGFRLDRGVELASFKIDDMRRARPLSQRFKGFVNYDAHEPGRQSSFSAKLADPAIYK
jgi:hypothetical protein